MSTGTEGEAAPLPVLSRFKGCLDKFIKNMTQICTRKNVPAYFVDFTKQLDDFSNEIASSLMALEVKQSQQEGQLAIQKTVIDRLDNERERLKKRVQDLEEEMEDHRQYSRYFMVLTRKTEKARMRK